VIFIHIYIYMYIYMYIYYTQIICYRKWGKSLARQLAIACYFKPPLCDHQSKMYLSCWLESGTYRYWYYCRSGLAFLNFNFLKSYKFSISYNFSQSIKYDVLHSEICKHNVEVEILMRTWDFWYMIPPYRVKGSWTFGGKQRL
jgi:hypothetical protein